MYISTMPGSHHPHRRPHPGRRSRNRREVAPGEWEVTARVERFVEPALLLALRAGRSHGYELAERLADVIGVESIDYGNLYRLLRSLEQEGIVSSEWDDETDGRSKREYELTESGELLLGAWVESLRQADERIAAFLRRYDERNQT
jgi:poly-beta-hydroxybutyrate-responsive repressor